MSDASNKNDTKKVAMVSGHTDLTEEEFLKYYKEKIDDYLVQGYSFVVGGADGADKLTQLYLSTYPKVEVTVYDKGSQKNVHCNRFKHVNGFSSYPERDEAMTDASSVDICILRQHGGGGSGTAANLYRRKFGKEMAKDIIKIIRENSMPYVEKPKS